jgi:hypothetical protein
MWRIKLHLLGEKRQGKQRIGKYHACYLSLMIAYSRPLNKSVWSLAAEATPHSSRGPPRASGLDRIDCGPPQRLAPDLDHPPMGLELSAGVIWMGDRRVQEDARVAYAPEK